MKINGKEINFKFTVRAQLQTAALCADKKLANLSKLFAGDEPDETRAKALFEVGRIMNNCYEQSKRKERGEPVDLEADYSLITFDDFLDLEPTEEAQFEREVIEAINGGHQRSVEAAPPKGSKKNKNAQESN